MSKSKYLPAADGLLARVSGRWAETKLAVLSGYMTITNKALRNIFEDRSFIDLMTGGGKCVIATSRNTIIKEFDGSPLLAQACSPAFTSLVFVEEHQGLVSALTQRLGTEPRATIIAGDCNDLEVIGKIRSTVPQRAFGVIFADNLGLNVTFDTIRRLTAGRRWDVVVTFQVSAIKRTKHLAALDSGSEAARWDSFFGTHEWLRVMENYEAKRLKVLDLGTALLALYAKQMATIGYTAHCALPWALTNSRGGKLYTVELFSKHSLGCKLFTVVSPRDKQILLGL